MTDSDSSTSGNVHHTNDQKPPSFDANDQVRERYKALLKEYCNN